MVDVEGAVRFSSLIVGVITPCPVLDRSKVLYSFQNEVVAVANVLEGVVGMFLVFQDKSGFLFVNLVEATLVVRVVQGAEVDVEVDAAFVVLDFIQHRAVLKADRLVGFPASSDNEVAVVLHNLNGRIEVNILHRLVRVEGVGLKQDETFVVGVVFRLVGKG